MWLIFLFSLFISASQCALNIPLCPGGGQPVCAQLDYEYIYFENECKFDVYSYKQLFAGKPRPTKVPLEQCFSNCAGIICPDAYQPVCAMQIVDGTVVTVPNACMVNQLICETKKQWTILGRGACPQSTSKSDSQSSYESAPVSAQHTISQNKYEHSSNEYKSTTDDGKRQESAYYPASIPTGSAVSVATNPSAYSHKLNAFAASSDQYSIASYASLAPASPQKTSYSGSVAQNHIPQAQANSGPHLYQHVSSLKSQQISYASSEQGSAAEQPSLYHYSVPIEVTGSSHSTYEHTGNVAPAPSALPIYAAPSQSHSDSPGSYSQSSNQGGAEAATNHFVKEQHSHEEKPTHVYQGEAQPTVATSYENAQYSHPARSETSNTANAAAIVYENSEPSAEGQYRSETTYQGAANARVATYENSQISHSVLPTEAANQGEVQAAAAAYENFQPSDAGPYLSVTRNQGDVHATAVVYENSQPSGEGPYQSETAYQGEVKAAAAAYENSQPADAGPYQSEAAYQQEAHAMVAGYENSQISHSVPLAAAGPYQAEDAYQGEVQAAAAAYENSNPSDLGTHQSEIAYQGDVQPTAVAYEISKPSDAASYQPEDAYQGEVQAAAAAYENSHPSDVGRHQSETAYQGDVQPTAVAYENSQPTAEGPYQSQTAYQGEAHAGVAAHENSQISHSVPPAAVVPYQSENAYQGEVQAAANTYENPKPSHAGAYKSESTYQGEVQAAAIAYENSQAPHSIPATAAGPYQSVDTTHAAAAATYENPQAPHSVPATDSGPYQSEGEVISDAYSVVVKPFTPIYEAAPVEDGPVPEPSSYSSATETHSASTAIQSTYSALSQQSSNHNYGSRIPNLNIFLSPALTPAINVFTAPYGYATAAASPTASHVEIPYPQDSYSMPSYSSNSDYWPAEPLPLDVNEIPAAYDPELAALVMKWVDSKADRQPKQKISEAYNPKLAALVTNWVDSREDNHYEPAVHDAYGSKQNGYAPFYYQPSYTIIHYNCSQSPSHSYKK